MKTDYVLMEVLVNAKNRAQHNLSCYSKSWTFTAPIEGFENEYTEAKAEYNKIFRLIEKYTLD